MIGSNGGLLGSRRVPSTSSARGVWTANEQSLAKRAGIWPGTPGIETFSPVIWYDFADEATVSLSGTEVTGVSDKGSRGWGLSKGTTGPQYVAGINGKQCIDWGTAGHQNYLRNTSTTTTSLAEVYIVLDANFGSTFPNNNGLITATGSGWLLGGDNSGGTGFWDYANLPSWLFDSAYINGSATNSYDVVLPAINSPTLIRVTRTAGPLTATDGICVGNDRSGFSTRGWGGLIGEIVVFSSVLSTGDRTSVQNILAAKWGITLV